MGDDDFGELFAESTPEPPSPEQLAARKKRRLTTRLVAGGIALALIIAAAIYIPATLTAEPGLATAQVSTLEVTAGKPAQLRMPTGAAVRFSITGGESFAAMTGVPEIVQAAGTEAALPMASISKLITALVILDAKPLASGETGPTLTFSRAQYKIYDKYYLLGATTEKMGIGSSMSQKDAMAIMLIASASNYAEVLSTWAYGSQPAFVAAAQRWLAAHGMNSTTFVEPTGIDARNASTASDLMVLAGLVLADPVLSGVVATANYSVEGWGSVSNRNLLVNQGVTDGIKTGTLSGQGANLLFSARVDAGLPERLHLVGVVLDSNDQTYIGNDVKALIASIKEGFHIVPVIAQDDVVGSYMTQWGAKANIVAASSAGMRVWSDTPIEVAVEMRKIATASPGDIVGTATFTAGPSSQTVQLTVDKALEGPNELWRLTHPAELLGW